MTLEMDLLPEYWAFVCDGFTLMLDDALDGDQLALFTEMVHHLRDFFYADGQGLLEVQTDKYEHLLLMIKYYAWSNDDLMQKYLQQNKMVLEPAIEEIMAIKSRFDPECKQFVEVQSEIKRIQEETPSGTPNGTPSGTPNGTPRGTPMVTPRVPPTYLTMPEPLQRPSTLIHKRTKSTRSTNYY